MARYDKYDPYVGNFRAPLAAAFAEANLNKIIGVGLDANGRIVLGAGNTGITGVINLTKVKNAGDVVDVMKHGECVEMTGLAAGTNYTVSTVDGSLSNAAADATHIKVGHTVEATRLIVNVATA